MAMPPDLPGPVVHGGAIRPGRDALERMSRLAAAAGITRQHRLAGTRANHAEVTGALRRAAVLIMPGRP